MSNKTNCREGELSGDESVKKAHHGLRVVPGAESEMKRIVPADDGLRELLESFKRLHKDQQQSSNDDNLPPAA